MIKMGKKAIIILSSAAVVLWMLLIFNFSSQVREESNELSKGVTEIVVKIVEKVVPDSDFDINKFNHIIRKNAHFFVYLVLGVLVLNAMRRSGVSRFKEIILTLLICILYAISDEIHQAYVPGRGPQVKDVLIDSCGSILGICIYCMVSRIKRRFFT